MMPLILEGPLLGLFSKFADRSLSWGGATSGQVLNLTKAGLRPLSFLASTRVPIS